jgi:hypothetical protein
LSPADQVKDETAHLLNSSEQGNALPIEIVEQSASDRHPAHEKEAFNSFSSFSSLFLGKLSRPESLSLPPARGAAPQNLENRENTAQSDPYGA